MAATAIAPSKADALVVATKALEVVNGLTKRFDTFIETAKKTPAGGHPSPADVFGLPFARTGEDSMSSRGFSFLKMIGLLDGTLPVEEAKVEMDIHNRLNQCLNGHYTYGGAGPTGGIRGKFLAPLSTAFLPDKFVQAPFRREMKSLVLAGVDGSDPGEANWIRRKMLESLGYGTKDLSWLDNARGGALVAPPQMGELIELLRNQEALVAAGARTVPLPPQGRMIYPRQTTASNTYWVGESKRITDSNIGTGEVTLQAKKLAVLIKAPNELIRFASPAAEAIMRDDMTKSLALGLDLAGLEGAGGDSRPLGIILRNGINTITAKNPKADGDKLVGEEIYRMIAAVEESNATMEGWIMRPKTLYKFYQLRADAVGQGDSTGMFLFSAIREPGESAKPMLGGYPVTKSTQVSQVRSKGANSDLTYILAGMFSDVLIGMFGAIEFAATTQGDTAFENDQTWVRGILSADIQVRHEAAFAFMDNLDVVRQ